MSLVHTARQLGATVLGMLRTRLELAAVELEEESRRVLGYAALGLLALFLAGLTLVFIALFIVILFWDSYRLEAVGGLVLVFGAASVVLGLKVKNSLAAKPRFMAATVAEFGKDLDLVRGHHE
ncbi:MAG: phage holin family protein [Gammaproteobacteria bacterium]